MSPPSLLGGPPRVVSPRSTDPSTSRRGRPRLHRGRLLATSLSILALGCGPSPSDRTVLSVFAASSLTEAFTQLELAFEERHRDIDVRTSFAGSQVLRLQIEQGASADLFASANPFHIQALADVGLIGEHRVFAHNELVVVVPADDPAGVHSFADLPRAQRVVLGTDNVPVGIYAREVIARARASLGDPFGSTVLDHVVSEESSVRLIRAKVALGEADAAFVYRSDVPSSSPLRIVPIPSEFNVRADYTLGRLAGSSQPQLAASFTRFVRSEVGDAILTHHHFVPEPP